MGIVPASWMPNCSMKRIILHWTAGGHKASSNDTSHYHILIEDDGKLVRGTHTIEDNVSTADNVYAAHVARFNRGSIGVSVCCMAGARESPFNAGSFPMTQTQWETMAQVVAELCDFYDIEVTQRTVLGHGEVEKVHGINQGGKWDPLVLPWDTSLSKSQVGEEFRSLVKAKITGQTPRQEFPAAITAIVQGETFREARIFNEKSLIKVRPLIDRFEGTISGVGLFEGMFNGIMDLTLNISEQPIPLTVLLIDDHESEFLDLSEVENEAGVSPENAEAMLIKLILMFGSVKATDLADALNLSVSWDGVTRTVTLS